MVYWILSTFSLLILSLILNAPVGAQVDGGALLSLRFDNSVNGEQGEVPVSAVGQSYQAGVLGQAVSLPAGSMLAYSAANNIDAREGTIEFWLKPSWNGNDGRSHALLDWNGGGFGGMLIQKHNFNRLLVGLDRFGSFNDLEFDVSDWLAGKWYYVAITYSNADKKIEIYINGTVKATKTFTLDLPQINQANFQIGGYGSTNPAESEFDEFRISNRARTESEIRSRFLSGLAVSSIGISSTTKTLWPTWKLPFTVTAQTNIGPLGLPASSLTLSSTDPSKAFLGNDGNIQALTPGSAILTAQIQQAQASIPILISTPARPPSVVVPTGSRSLPAGDYLYEIPVVSLRYIPTSDGINVDTSWAPGFFTLEPVTVEQLERKIDSNEEVTKFMLEEGSRFRGYGSHVPPPSLGYRIIATITIYEPTPPGPVKEFIQNQPVYFHEMTQILERAGMQNYVENSGVKQIWFWGSELAPFLPSYNPAVHTTEKLRRYWESDMASPTTGDVSNSNQSSPALPVYSKTYVLNNRVIRLAEGVPTHTDGHQLERMLSYASRQQDGNSWLFERRFWGGDANGFQRGRAGNVHFPPNARFDYDYDNAESYPSDITDWKPEGGGQILYSSSTARAAPYTFPSNIILGSDRFEPHWYIFWRQSMPGYGNVIPYQVGSTANRMTNWWQFTGDWDRSNRAGVGLYEPASCSYALSTISQDFPAAGGAGSVSVASSTGCKWYASNNANWSPLVSGDIGNGSGQVNFMVQPNTTASPRTTKIIVTGQPFVINQSAAQIPVNVGGRVTTPTGLGIRNAVVSIVDSLGVRRTAMTSSFGVYSFANVAAGGNYTISVSSKRFRFAARTLTVGENLSNVDFVGLE